MKTLGQAQADNAGASSPARLSLHAHFYLEVVLSALSISLGIYLLRDVLSPSSRDTFPSLLLGSVLVTAGVIFAGWSIKTRATMRSWERAGRMAVYHGSRMHGKFGPH
jgi:hypothetical protein